MKSPENPGSVPKKSATQRLGLVMIAASLAVAAIVIAFVLQMNRENQLEQCRNEGKRLMHVFPRIQFKDFSPEAILRECLHAASGVEKGANFAYFTVRDVNGALAGEVMRPGISIPPFQMLADPSSWYSERTVRQPGDGRVILEYAAPLLDKGELAGSAVLGFFEPGYLGSGLEERFLAALCLPVILLGAFFYFLFKRETQPINTLTDQIQALLERDSPDRQVEIQDSAVTQELVQRLNAFMERGAARIRKVEEKHSQLVATDKVLLYKKARLKAILEELPDGVLVMDESCSVTYANSKAANLLGSAIETLVGSAFAKWCTDEGLSAFLSHYLGSRGRLRRSEGVEFSPAHIAGATVAVHAFPLVSRETEGATFGTLVVIRDVTAEALARQARNEFVTHVAHELKSPLNVLRMASETLLDETGGAEAFHVDAINTIYDEVERLSLLINSLLSISKIEMGSLSLDRQRIRMQDLLKDSLETMAKNDRHAQLEFKLDLPKEMSPIFADKDLLRVAVNNLLTNAIKYNRPGGQVILSAQETEDQIVVRVRDTGVGIAADDQGRIFDKFFRSDREEVRKNPGHGLGLPLTKSIVECHQGQLLVESTLGQGSEFAIVLEKSNGIVREGI